MNKNKIFNKYFRYAVMTFSAYHNNMLSNNSTNRVIIGKKNCNEVRKRQEKRVLQVADNELM